MSMHKKQQRRASLADLFPGMIRTSGGGGGPSSSSSSVSINNSSNGGGDDSRPSLSRAKPSGGFGQSSGASATVMSDKLKLSLAKDLFPSKNGSSGNKSKGSASISTKVGDAVAAGGLRGSDHSKMDIMRGSGSKSTNDLVIPTSSTSSPPLSPSATRKVVLPSALKKGGLKKTSSTSPEHIPSDSSDKTASTACSSTMSSKKAWEDEDDEEYSLDVPLRDAFGGGGGHQEEEEEPQGHAPRRRAPKRTSSMKKDGAPRRKVPQRSVSADQLTGMNVQVRLPNSSKPLRKTRSISFSKSVQVRKIPSQTELLEREVQDEKDARNELFFQAEEYDTIKRKTGALVRAIQQGRTPGGVTYCTRGLEKYFRMEEVQMKRIAAWDSVLYEQDNQRLQRKYDDSRLADSYSQWTHESEEDAAERARQDEEAIENYTRKTRIDIRRTVSSPTFRR
mmetsp:Transcript_20867/g.49556  ORF Transcript_20867/g.49556 Transcript_20867/m.49556 type:complete len:449 (-) Transcript_20867:465-1811(-)